MKESGKPRYVDRSNEIVYRPPYLESNTRLTAWALSSDLTRLQALCDQALRWTDRGGPRLSPPIGVGVLGSRQHRKGLLVERARLSARLGVGE